MSVCVQDGEVYRGFFSSRVDATETKTLTAIIIIRTQIYRTAREKIKIYIYRRIKNGALSPNRSQLDMMTNHRRVRPRSTATYLRTKSSTFLLNDGGHRCGCRDDFPCSLGYGISAPLAKLYNTTYLRQIFGKTTDGRRSRVYKYRMYV